MKVESIHNVKAELKPVVEGSLPDTQRRSLRQLRVVDTSSNLLKEMVLSTILI